MVEKNLNEEFQLAHELFLLDANLERSLHERHKESMTEKFVSELLSTLGMERLAPLQIYGATDARAPGWSFVQLITTSHIFGHYFGGASPHLHLDVYSCKAFDWQQVVEIAHAHFSLQEWKGSCVTRNTDWLSRKHIEIAGKGDMALSSDESDVRVVKKLLRQVGALHAETRAK